MSKLTNLQKQLFEVQDLKYKEFQAQLIPTIDAERIIGIRTPQLRKFAKQYAKTEEAEQFLKELPHTYYEENNLHMILLSGRKDYKECVKDVDKFLPYVDNWATCDLPAPKCFGKHKNELIVKIKEWIRSTHTYTIRYAIGMLMRFYLEEDFLPEYLELVANIESEEYYVNMMIAWYMATALVKQWKVTVPYIEERKLSSWVHRKTIQKAVESYRITKEQKEYLKGFRK